jgi:hypothetical protein
MNPAEREIQNESLRSMLFSRLAEKAAEFRDLLEKMESHSGIENDVYRFYHQSFKAYQAQDLTLEAVKLLQSLLPERPLNEWFMQIVKEGTGKTFELSHNENWLPHTRPMLEALFHAHYFVRMACKYGHAELRPGGMNYGQGAVLYLFDLR